MTALGSQDLAGRAVLVAGGGSGMGAAVCHELAVDGADVAVLDDDHHAACGTARRIAAIGGSAAAYVAPRHDELALASAIRHVARDHGRLDALVHCASIDSGTLPMHGAADPCDASVQALLRSTLLHARLALPYLRRADTGRIVSVITVSQPAHPVASHGLRADQWALLGLSDALARALQRERIEVTAIVASDDLPARNGTGPGLHEVVCACDPLEVALAVRDALAPHALNAASVRRGAVGTGLNA